MEANAPQALQIVLPSESLLQSGVAEVPQAVQIVFLIDSTGPFSTALWL